MKKIIGYLSFFLLFTLIVVMGMATWQEHLKGTQYAMNEIYNTTWFNLLWVSVSVLSTYYIWANKLYRKLPAFMLHLSLIVILTGALITRFNGKTGMIHLRENIENRTFFCEEDQDYIHLPFSLLLNSFQIEYYPGTTSPSNYISIIEIKDKSGNTSLEKEISMNNILKHEGYRFYQSSFDPDMKGSILSINYDSTGIIFTYTGYFLLFFSMLWIFFDSKGRFTELVKKTTKNKFASILIICLFSFFPVHAETTNSLLSKDGATVNREQSNRFAKLKVYYNGRICPLQTLAIDFTTKLTGKPKYKYANAEQVLLGWIFFPEKWQHVPLFDIRNEELKNIINNSGKACFSDFFNSKDQSYKLAPYHVQIYGSEQKSALIKEAAKLDEKIQLIAMIQNGELLQMFPFETSEKLLRWYTPTEQFPENISKQEILFAQNFFSLYYEYIRDNNINDTNILLDKLTVFQNSKTQDIFSESHFKAELILNKINIFSLLFKINLTIGCIAILFFISGVVRNQNTERIQHAFYYILMLMFIVLTIALALRGYVAGRLPMSNGYETMLFIAWCTLSIGVLSRKYSFLITCFSFLLSGFVLLVAHIGSTNPQITPLVPVLQSPLLSIHVSLIMISYGLCGFMLLNSLTAFILLGIAPRKRQTKINTSKLKELNELFMYPATFFLGAGIFVGAIWANVSWGRYWGWDPKEVWALITFLLMSFTFHGKTLEFFKKPVIYHLFILIIFASVLMTYFGVNFVLGGKHSYGG